MENSYKLYKVREMASGDEEFVKALAEAFIQEIPDDLFKLHEAVSQNDASHVKYYAHKMKPTLDMFETGLVNTALTLEKWGEQPDEKVDIVEIFSEFEAQVNIVIEEIRKDFNL